MNTVAGWTRSLARSCATCGLPKRRHGFYLLVSALRARYYGPTTAQMLTRDPLASVTGAPHAYVNDNPLNAADPSGLDQWANSPGPSGLNPNDPNYCWELLRLIRAVNNAVGQRWHEQQMHLDQLVSGNRAE